MALDFKNSGYSTLKILNIGTNLRSFPVAIKIRVLNSLVYIRGPAINLGYQFIGIQVCVFSSEPLNNFSNLNKFISSIFLVVSTQVIRIERTTVVLHRHWYICSNITSFSYIYHICRQRPCGWLGPLLLQSIFSQCNSICLTRKYHTISVYRGFL